MFNHSESQVLSGILPAHQPIFDLTLKAIRRKRLGYISRQQVEKVTSQDRNGVRTEFGLSWNGIKVLAVPGIMEELRNPKLHRMVDIFVQNTMNKCWINVHRAAFCKLLTFNTPGKWTPNSTLVGTLGWSFAMCFRHLFCRVWTRLICALLAHAHVPTR